jgi:hypothetical protein
MKSKIRRNKSAAMTADGVLFTSFHFEAIGPKAMMKRIIDLQSEESFFHIFSKKLTQV